MGKGGGGGPQDIRQTTSNLPEYARPYFTKALERTLYESARPYQAFPGQRLADFSPQESLAMQGMEGLAAAGSPEQFLHASNIAQNIGYGGGLGPWGQGPPVGIADAGGGTTVWPAPFVPPPGRGFGRGSDIAGRFNPQDIASQYTGPDIDPGYAAGDISQGYQAGARQVGYTGRPAPRPAPLHGFIRSGERGGPDLLPVGVPTPVDPRAAQAFGRMEPGPRESEADRQARYKENELRDQRRTGRDAFRSAFPDAPPPPRFETQDMATWINPITGQQESGGSSRQNYQNRLKEYLDANPAAQESYTQNITSLVPPPYSGPPKTRRGTEPQLALDLSQPILGAPDGGPGIRPPGGPGIRPPGGPGIRPRGGQFGPGFTPGTVADPRTIERYMNPYQQMVTDIEKREAARQSKIMGTQIGQQAAQTGGLGGYREAIIQAERERNLGQQLGDIQTRGSQAAFQQAQQAFEADRAARLQAGQLGLQMGGAREQALQAGERFGQQQFMTNEQLRQQQQQADLGAYQAGEQARQQAGRMGLSAQEVEDRGQQAEDQARLGAQRFNVEAQRQRAEIGLRGLGADQAGTAQRLDAARVLGGFGQQQQQMDYERLKNLQASGEIQRQLGQRGMTMGYQDFLRQQAFPREQLGLFNQMLRGLPIQPGSTVATYGGPSSMERLLGSGIAGVGLYNQLTR